MTTAKTKIRIVKTQNFREDIPLSINQPHLVIESGHES